MFDEKTEEKDQERLRFRLWHDQVMPKFRGRGLTAQQIETAKAMFCAGFDAGWDSHRAFLLQQFALENQKQKVHLA